MVRRRFILLTGSLALACGDHAIHGGAGTNDGGASESTQQGATESSEDEGPIHLDVYVPPNPPTPGPPPSSCMSAEAGVAQFMGTSPLGAVAPVEAWWGQSQCQLRIVVVGSDEVLVVDTPAGYAWNGVGPIEPVTVHHIVGADTLESSGVAAFELVGADVEGMVEVQERGWSVQGSFVAHHCEDLDWMAAPCE
jgi:hypothetical protein